MKSFAMTIVLVIVSSLYQETESKTTNCRNKFKEEDFLYCTKFGMPETGKATVKMSAKFMSTYRKSEEHIDISVGVFRDSVWD